MARTHARVKASVWTDDDWRTLSPEAQWMYFMLISQPQINNCGVLPYVPTRWARLATGLSVEAVNELLLTLEEERFIVSDPDAGEVLVRSFIKHDGVEKQPNVLKAALRQFDEIESSVIREMLSGEYPHLFGGSQAVSPPLREPLPEPPVEPLAPPLPEGVPEPLPNPVDNGPAKPLIHNSVEPLREPLRVVVNARVPSPTPLRTTPSVSQSLDHLQHSRADGLTESRSLDFEHTLRSVT